MPFIHRFRTTHELEVKMVEIKNLRRVKDPILMWVEAPELSCVQTGCYLLAFVFVAKSALQSKIHGLRLLAESRIHV